MAQTKTFGGIDCGKEHLDFAVFPAGDTMRVPNTPAGYRSLIDGLSARPITMVGIEASGGYERAVRDALTAAGLTVCVLDPARVRHFAKAKGQRAKTDLLDAALIAEFTAQFQSTVRPAVDPQREPLAGLLGLRRLLVDKRADLHKALALLPDSAASLVRPALDGLDEAIEALEWTITRKSQADAVLAGKIKALQSAPGVGALTAVTLAVLVPELGRLSGGQAAALLGVAPYPDDSGHRHGVRRIAGGRDDARRALYMAALSAATGRRKGVLAAFYASLTGRGKPPKLALTACMRKLIVRLNAMLAHGQTWNEETA